MAEQPRQFHRISCPCGAALKIDLLSTTRRLRCPKCGLILDCVVSIDKRNGRPLVSIVVSAESVKLEGQSLGAADGEIPERPEPEPEPAPEPEVEFEEVQTRVRGRTTAKGVLGTCICGTSFPVDDQELTSIQACPQCGIEYHCVVKIERGTKVKTAILVPVKTLPARRGTIAPGAMPTPTKTGKARTQVPLKSRTRPPAPKARPTIPPGAQGVDCPCGEPLVVRKRDVAKGMECPSCGRALRFQEVPDPQTLHPVIRVRPEKK